MAKKKPALKNYAVAVRLEYQGTVYVLATSEEDALEKVRVRDWYDSDLDELVDWTSVGSVTVNE